MDVRSPSQPFVALPLLFRSADGILGIIFYWPPGLEDSAGYPFWAVPPPTAFTTGYGACAVAQGELVKLEYKK